jgi:hypothetical protein
MRIKFQVFMAKGLTLGNKAKLDPGTRVMVGSTWRGEGALCSFPHVAKDQPRYDCMSRWFLIVMVVSHGPMVIRLTLGNQEACSSVGVLICYRSTDDGLWRAETPF